jgi:hypothetical protein
LAAESDKAVAYWNLTPFLWVPVEADVVLGLADIVLADHC